MNIQSLFKKLLPHLLIIAGFFVISLVYFSPMMKGKVLQQHDYMQFLGSSKEALDFNKATGESAYWTNSMFGGMPTYQIALGYPKSAFIVGWIYTFFVKTFAHPLNSLFFYMIGFYLLLQSYKLDKWVCAIGALAFAFSSYNLVIISAGHINKSYAIAFAPFVLAAINYIFLWRKYFLGTALLALAMVTEIKCNHIQITYYLLILIAIYAVYQAIVHVMEKRIPDLIKAGAGLAIGIILAFGANFSSTYVTNEYATQTIRGKAELTDKTDKDRKEDGLDKTYALDWSYGVAETGTLMIPDIRGGSQAALGQMHPSAVKGLTDQNNAQYVEQMDEYWGVEPATGVIYFGAVVCFLFVLGMFALKGYERWWLFAATLLFIMLSWGKYYLGLTDFFFNHFPLYNKFRSVSMILAMASITVPILAFIILDRISKDPGIIKNNMRNLYIAFGLTGGICLILAMAPSFAGDFTQAATLDPSGKVERKSERDMLADNIRQSNTPPEQVNAIANGIIASLAEARESILRASALRSLAFIALGAGAIFLFGLGKINKHVLVGCIGALVLIDMPVLDKRYLNDEMFKPKNMDTEQQVEMSAADQEILKDKDPDYRVLNVSLSSFNDATTSYYHKSIGGYHGAKLRRIQDLIQNVLYDDINIKLRQNRFDEAYGLNMLNAKYFIVDPTNPKGVIQNPSAYGNAWFIKDVKMAKTADEEMATLKSINPRNEGVVSDKFADYFKDGVTQWQDSTAKVKLDKYSPNELTYSYNAAADGFITFSEIYYNPNVDKDWHKGDWQAYIDGKEVDHIRVDYVLRGMKVPAGSHKIDFKFIPHSYIMAENVSLASSILILLLLGGSIFMEMKKGKEVVKA